MRSLQSVSTGVLAEILKRQPASAGRTTFAWTVAAGPGLARATRVHLDAGVLRVHAGDPRWAAEVRRARPLLVERLQQLLGADAVTRIDVDS